MATNLHSTTLQTVEHLRGIVKHLEAKATERERQAEAALAAAAAEKEQVLEEQMGERAARRREVEAAGRDRDLTLQEMKAVEKLMAEELQGSNDALQQCQHDLHVRDAQLAALSSRCAAVAEQGEAWKRERDHLELRLDALVGECDSLKAALAEKRSEGEIERAALQEQLSQERASAEMVQKQLMRQVHEMQLQVRSRVKLSMKN